MDEDLEDHQKLDVREYILRIFKYLVNYKHGLLDYLKKPLDTLKVRLAQKAMESEKDKRELLTKELNLILEVYNAPFTTIKSNVDNGETPSTGKSKVKSH